MREGFPSCVRWATLGMATYSAAPNPQHLINKSRESLCAGGDCRFEVRMIFA